MTESRPLPYVAARVAAFVRANAWVHVCADCWRRLARARAALAGRADTPGWCARCGRAGATIRRALPLPGWPSLPGRRPAERALKRTA
jgi:hypothetical protein